MLMSYRGVLRCYWRWKEGEGLTGDDESTATGAEEEEGDLCEFLKFVRLGVKFRVVNGSDKFPGGLRRHFEAQLGRFQWGLRRRGSASWTAVEPRWQGGSRFHRWMAAS